MERQIGINTLSKALCLFYLPILYLQCSVFSVEIVPITAQLLSSVHYKIGSFCTSSVDPNMGTDLNLGMVGSIPMKLFKLHDV